MSKKHGNDNHSCSKNVTIMDGETGELFCEKCGFVFVEKITDAGAEWRSFPNDQTDKTRVGAGTSLTIHDRGLSTVIGGINKDAAGKPLTVSLVLQIIPLTSSQL